MKLVYSKGEEFCNCLFIGNKDIAFNNGYKEIDDEMYKKLINKEAHWVNGELKKIVKRKSKNNKNEKE